MFEIVPGIKFTGTFLKGNLRNALTLNMEWREYKTTLRRICAEDLGGGGVMFSKRFN